MQEKEIVIVGDLVREGTIQPSNAPATHKFNPKTKRIEPVEKLRAASARKK